MKEPIIKKTKDGSNTLYSDQFNQTYHNIGGAITESNHVFFETNGLNDALKNEVQINILEIGFGTGLNFLLLADAYLNENSRAKINYYSVEAHPISSKMFEKLNYGRHLNRSEINESLKSVFGTLQEGINNFTLQPNISLTIFYGTFAHFNPGDVKFDFIFHDAFSPETNSELWSASVFEKLLKWSNPKAALTTYCAASKARGAMAAAGWNVARAPGAPGKREMTIASPNAEVLKPFKRVNEKRLAKRFKEGDFD